MFTDATDNFNGTFTPVSNDNSTHLHWNEAQNRQLTTAMLQSTETAFLLKRKLSSIRDILTAEGSDKVGSYGDDQVNNIVAAAVMHPGTQGLFDVEMNLALDIRSACLEIAKFLASAGGEADVFGAFEDFASGLTRSFSSDLRNLWANDTLLLPLGPFLLKEAATVFDPTLSNLQMGAMFTIDASNVATTTTCAALPPSAPGIAITASQAGG